MIRIFRPESFTKSLWRNGRGVSWEIADCRSTQGADFGWRFSIAEIAGDCPFSVYGPVDRWFTLLDGNGLTLKFSGGSEMTVGHHDPRFFACDVPADCVLSEGPCRALNLFVSRPEWSSEARIAPVDDVSEFDPQGRTVLLFALHGDCSVACHGMVAVLKAGGAALLETGRPIICAAARTAKLYIAELRKLR